MLFAVLTKQASFKSVVPENPQQFLLTTNQFIPRREATGDSVELKSKSSLGLALLSKVCLGVKLECTVKFRFRISLLFLRFFTMEKEYKL